MYTPYNEWFKLILDKEHDGKTIEVLENALFSIKGTLEKLEAVKINLKLFVKDSNSTSEGAITNDVTYMEGIRMLMIGEMLSAGKEITAGNLSHLKKQNPTKHDIANEGRIVKTLEEKGYVKLDLNSASQLTRCKISLTDIGKTKLEHLIASSSFLRNAYNRSRNNKIKQFIRNYLD